MNIKLNQLTYLAVSALTMVTGYAYFRLTYRLSDHFPFSQEIILILLGSIVTITITSLLLNKQTSVEVEKEQNIKYLELKTSTYEKLLHHVEEMALMDKFTSKEITQLKFITHRLAIIASPEVLNEYRAFLRVISVISQDRSFVKDSDQLHEAISALTLKIRDDLIGTSQSKTYNSEQIEKIIRHNSDYS